MKKAVFRFITLFLIIPVSYLLSEGYVLCEEPSLDYIVEKMKAKQLNILGEIDDSICLAESIYREMRKDGGLKKRVVTKKRIYMKGTSKRHEECLSMNVNGRMLSKAEMEKEFKNGGDQQEVKLPLTPEGEGHYDFHLAGSGVCNGMDVWMIDFRAKKKKDEFVNGRGYISKDTFDVVRIELVPAKLSRLVEDLKVSVTSARIQGYWMPVKFEMDLKIRVSFLYYKHITVEETYSEYRLNNQLEDSIFESK